MFIRKRRLTASEMVKMEKLVQEKCGELGPSSQYDLPSGLLARINLKLVPESDESFPKDKIAILAPCRDVDKGKCNGIVRIRESRKEETFPVMHEIMHYILEVGISQEVTEERANTIAGEEKTFKEQLIDYAAAAYLIPIEDISDMLAQYDKENPKQDLLKKTLEMSKQYNCSTETVVRRIKEARKISWHNKYASENRAQA